MTENSSTDKNVRPSRFSRYGLYLAVFLLIVTCLASYIPPALLFQDSTPTGGDTASHYAAAQYFLDVILPHGKITGWMPGNFAGFPLFQYYFPLPFLLMAILKFFMPLTVAFKLITILGICTLPLAAFGALRAMNLPSPIPSLGALFTLPFLFMEANSMWGGNIPSTLAGEFNYSIALSLMVYLSGRLYRDIHTGKNLILNSILEAIMGLCHGYPLLFFGFASSFFLLSSQGFSKRFRYLLGLHCLAFCFMGFWLVPLLYHLGWTTPFNYVWILEGFKQVIPAILWPGAILALVAVLGATLSWLRNREQQNREILLAAAYFFWMIVLAFGFYLIAYKLGVVDIRFLPFAQLYLMLLGGLGMHELTKRLKAPGLLVLTVGCATLFWIQGQVHYIHQWARWNYSGFENRSLWPTFSEVNRHVKGQLDEPRVVYEHSSLHQHAGTVRAFECLPFFSGRSTLEGVYFQGSISSPFVFYLQSEISKEASHPFPTYSYSRFNLDRGLKHLVLFNVSQFIAIAPETIAALDQHPDVQLDAEFSPYRVYRVLTNQNRYVEPLRHRPVVAPRQGWKLHAFHWFRLGDLQVPLVFVDPRVRKDIPSDWPRYTGNVKDLPRFSLPRPPEVKETIRDDEIIIETSKVNHPLLVKVSYHPNWRVEGADRVYLASPSFMLLYPKAHRVRLKFTAGIAENLGLALSLLGVLVAGASWIYLGISRRKRSSFEQLVPSRLEVSQPTALVTGGRRLHLLLVAAALLGFTLYAATVHHRDPTILYNRGKELVDRGKYEQARALFTEAIEEFPLSPVADFTLYQYAISYYKQENWEETIGAFRWMVDQYPESRLVAEAYYHMGLCFGRLEKPQEARNHFIKVSEEFPKSRWAGLAKERLSELTVE